MTGITQFTMADEIRIGVGCTQAETVAIVLRSDTHTVGFFMPADDINRLIESLTTAAAAAKQRVTIQ